MGLRPNSQLIFSEHICTEVKVESSSPGSICVYTDKMGVHELHGAGPPISHVAEHIERVGRLCIRTAICCLSLVITVPVVTIISVMTSSGRTAATDVGEATV